MDRTYLSGAAGSPPAVPGAPSSGYPTAGNPSTGTAATKPGPYWYHMIMEELLAVISAAGITPNQGTLTQLRDALRSAGLFQTPAQFDNTTKAATTAFVKTKGLECSAIRVLSGAATLTAADAGSEVYCGSPGSYAVTLPAISALPDGAMIKFCAFYGGITIARAGGDSIFIGNASSAVTSLALGIGDTLTLVKASTGWLIVDGAAQLKYSSVFGASLIVNGYQKLPSGLIFQWGDVSTNNGTGTWTFPIAFPNNCLQVFVGQDNTEPSKTVAASRNGATSALISSTGASGGDGFWAFAIGW